MAILMTKQKRGVKNAKSAALIRRMILKYWCLILSWPLWFVLLGFFIEATDEGDLAALLFFGSLPIFAVLFWLLKCPFCKRPVLTIPPKSKRDCIGCTPFLPKKCAYCSRDLRVKKKKPLAGVKKY